MIKTTAFLGSLPTRFCGGEEGPVGEGSGTKGSQNLLGIVRHSAEYAGLKRFGLRIKCDL